VGCQEPRDAAASRLGRHIHPGLTDEPRRSFPAGVGRTGGTRGPAPQSPYQALPRRSRQLARAYPESATASPATRTHSAVTSAGLQAGPRHAPGLSSCSKPRRDEFVTLAFWGVFWFAV